MHMAEGGGGGEGSLHQRFVLISVTKAGWEGVTVP